MHRPFTTFCPERAMHGIAPTLMVLIAIFSIPPAIAAGWDMVDRRVPSRVYQLNVATKTRLKNGLYAELSGYSPRMHYPVFSTTSKDHGFLVVMSGSCFPVQTVKHDRVYFLTNKHLIDTGDGMVQECAHFFAAMRLHAESTAGFISPVIRFRELLEVVNSPKTRKLSDPELSLYGSTVDAIWDTYDNHLSTTADPSRARLAKYLKMCGVEGTVALVIHSPGRATSPHSPTLNADVYKTSNLPLQPDIAVLSVNPAKMPGVIQPLELERAPLVEKQPVQAFGYPVGSKSGAAQTKQCAPTISTGQIVKLMPELIRFDAPVSKGNSGGPLIDQNAKVVGLVTKRANDPQPPSKSPVRTGTANSVISEKQSLAIDVQTIEAFTPELFAKAKQMGMSRKKTR